MTIQSWKYPGGEIGVRVTTIPDNPIFRIQSSDDLITLLLALNCYSINNTPITSITIPYLPYARQDRAIVSESKGAITVDPNSIEVLAKLFSTTTVRNIQSFDIHSVKSLESFNQAGINLVSVSPCKFISRFIQDLDLKIVYLVSPDKGATEKTKDYQTYLNSSGVIQCSKVRDPMTGKLTGFQVESDISHIEYNAVFLIIDDICDGGRTFLGVQEALTKTYGQHASYLFITHGIFSAGLETLLTKFNKIGCTNSFINNLIHPNLITYTI